MATMREAVVNLMYQICAESGYPYSQDRNLWGRYDTYNVLGHNVAFPAGQYDCSLVIIRVFESLGISCGGASYTGNMHSCMCEGTSNFIWHDWSDSYTMRPGDLAIRDDESDDRHVAMCIDYVFTFADFVPVFGGQIGERNGSYGWTGCIELADSVANQPWNGVGLDGGGVVGQIEENGLWGCATTSALQRRYGTPVDGIVSHQWAPNVQANSAVLLSESWQTDETAIGSTVIRALQADLGTEVDGIFGAADILALKNGIFGGVYGSTDVMTSACVWELQHQLNGGVWPTRINQA